VEHRVPQFDLAMRGVKFVLAVRVAMVAGDDENRVVEQAAFLEVS